VSTAAPMRRASGPLNRTTASALRPRAVAIAAMVSSAPGSGVGAVTATLSCYVAVFFARSFAISHCCGSAAMFCTA